MIVFNYTTAARVRFALSCLMEGVKRGRAQAHANAERERHYRQHAANIAARWID